MTACNTTLTTAGDYYLAANLTCDGDGIIIAGNNIKLDLHGNHLVGDGNGDGTGVSTSLPKGPDGRLGDAGVWVKAGFTGFDIFDSATKNTDCPLPAATTAPVGSSIRGFDVGVYVEGSQNSSTAPGKIRGLNIWDNIGGMATDFGEGVAILDSSYVIVEDNDIRHNGPFAGVGLYNWYTDDSTDNNTIRDNMICDNDLNTGPAGAQGFSSQDDGVRIEPGVDSTTVVSNTISRSGLEGVAIFFGGNVLDPTEGNVVKKNTITHNGFHEYVGPVGNASGGPCPAPGQLCAVDTETHVRNGEEVPNSNTPATTRSPSDGPNGYAQFPRQRFGDGVRVFGPNENQNASNNTIGGATSGSEGVGGTGDGNRVCDNAANGIRVDGGDKPPTTNSTLKNTIQNNRSGKNAGCTVNDVENDITIGQEGFDLQDGNAANNLANGWGACDSNTWGTNTWTTRSPKCIP